MTTVTLWQPGVVLARGHLTPAIIEAVKNALSPQQTLALTAWAEARSGFDGRRWVSNPIDAMVDIINVVDNRVKDPRWQVRGHKGVCLQRRQFSCWDTLGGPDNFYALMDRAQRLLAGEDPTDKLLNCLAAAEGCIGGLFVDTLGSATHYYAPASMIPPGRVPAWVTPTSRLTAERHGHRFYANVT